MVQVNIIEGDYSLVPGDVYEEIKNEYMNTTTTIRDLIAKYSISYNTWNKLKERIYEETGFSREVTSNGISNPKYYTRNPRGYYTVAKTINRKWVFFKQVKTEKEAQEIVKFLQANDWSKEKLIEWMGRI